MEKDLIAEALKEWLKEPGNTQVIAARELKIAEGTIRSRIEGGSEWKWSEVRKVADLTGKKVDDFV